MTQDGWRRRPVGILVSGGLDSCILVGDVARTAPAVYPIYVRFGLYWEAREEAGLRRYLGALKASPVQPLHVLECPLRDVYGTHWSTSGASVPDAATPDEAVYLPGRNLLLACQAAIWCHLHEIPTLAWGTLRGNPFSDARDEFFSHLQESIRLALESPLELVRPYATLTKTDVLRIGQDFPLGETLSCLHPEGDRHCGACNKCAERRLGFQAAGLVDPTRYAVDIPGN